MLVAIPGIFAAVLLAGWLSPGPVAVSPVTVLLSLVKFILGAIPEEIGWTAFATETAVPVLGITGAGLVIGAVWAVWHWIPWYVLQGRPFGWVAGMTVLTILVRIIMVLIWARGGRSLSAAILTHAALNTAFTLTPGQGAGVNIWLVAVFLLPVLLLLRRMTDESA